MSYMAIIWQKKIHNTLYEVRSAGKTRRLYSNGVFHSQYRPYCKLLGGIWDLLVLPAFFYGVEDIRRILVLGVGGGAIIHQLHWYFQVDEIIGVELNPVHIKIAKTHFGVKPQHASIQQADAKQWLESYQGPAFDLIIDDVFGEKDGEPIRAIPADKKWFGLLEKNIVNNGLIVINFASNKELKNCAYFHSDAIKRKFSSAFQYSLPLFENSIAAFLKKPVLSSTLRKVVYRRMKISREKFPYISRSLK